MKLLKASKTYMIVLEKNLKRNLIVASKKNSNLLLKIVKILNGASTEGLKKYTICH